MVQIVQQWLSHITVGHVTTFSLCHTFHLCDKCPRETVEMRGDLFDARFQTFTVSWLCSKETMVRWNIVVASRLTGAKLLTLWKLGIRGWPKRTDGYALSSHALWTTDSGQFPPAGFHDIPVMPLKLLAKNRLFPFVNWLAWGFCHSNRNLANVLMQSFWSHEAMTGLQEWCL